MATVRFSISMPATVRDRIREHAADAGLGVSTFLAIAAQAQMDQQDRLRKICEPFDTHSEKNSCPQRSRSH